MSIPHSAQVYPPFSWDKDFVVNINIISKLAFT